MTDNKIEEEDLDRKLSTGLDFDDEEKMAPMPQKVDKRASQLRRESNDYKIAKGALLNNIVPEEESDYKASK